MTDRIDLDELDAPTEEEETTNRGDWFWRNEGDDDWVESASSSTDDRATSPERSPDPADGADANASGDADADSSDIGPSTDTATPRVPYANDDRPVGIPMESGGAGGVPADEREAKTQQQPEASGPHGGGADEMTMAISYEAIRRLENLHAALADAETWTDWVGIVGDVDAHRINKYQRDHRLDLDFFNGTGTGPGERLAEIDEHSMFYSKRMVLVGVESAGERAWAEAADWEFVPLADAAADAGWSLSEE